MYSLELGSTVSELDEGGQKKRAAIVSVYTDKDGVLGGWGDKFMGLLLLQYWGLNKKEFVRI